MAGPADYGRVSGPLGGANFLSAAEYNTGQRMANQNTSQLLGIMGQGMQIGGQIRANQAADKAAAEKELFDNEIKAFQAAKYEAGLGATQQAPQPVAPAAAPVAQAPAAVAPTPAQTAQPTVNVQQPAPAAPAQVDVATQAPAAAPAPVMQEAATPAPVAQPVAAPAQAAQVNPPTVAQPAKAEAVAAFREQPTINGVPNFTAATKTRDDMALVKSLVDSGKMRPETAQMIVEQSEAMRQKSAERAVELRGKIAEIEDKETTTQKKRVEIAAETRKMVDNEFNDVYQIYQTAGPEAARAAAEVKGVPFDPNDPAQVKQLETRARRSEDFKAAQTAERSAAEETRKAAEEERKRLGVGTGKDVPAGVREIVSDGKVYYVDAEGRKLSQAQIEGMGLRKAAAGASRVSVNTSEVDNQPIPAGAVRLKGIKADDQIKAADNVEASSVVVENAQRMKQLYPQVVAASGINPNDSAFSAKFKNWVAKNVDNNAAAREYDTRRQQLVNANLRLNKGAQTEGDAQRERDALTSADMPLESHNATVDAIVQRATRQRQQAQAVIRGYIRPGEENAPSAAPAAPTANDFAKYKRGGK